jgi:uncharacterized repeat protein (TIGR01451 family)
MMFKKLISNLPFNPSLVQQVSFYGKRLRQETSVRRLGFLFVGLAFAVQLFAVIAPPQLSLAVSDNDIIRGGFTTNQQATLWCLDQNKDIGKILLYYGLTCDSVYKAPVVTIRSTDYNRQLNSMGRISYGPTIPNTGKPTNEYAVPIGGTTYYMRNLWSWDSGASSTYKALEMHNLAGQTFFMMETCGNIVSIGKYTYTPPPTPTTPVTPIVPTTPVTPIVPVTPTTPTSPNLVPHKTARNDTQNIADANSTTAQAGDVITYTLSLKNTGDGTAKNISISENMSDVLEYASISDFHGGTLDANNVIAWPASDIKAGQTVTQQVTIKVKNPIPNTPTPISNPNSYDLTMTNVYGDTVNIKLPPTVVKTTEQVTTALPNTGPGTTVAIGFAVAAIAGYFFFRSRLLAKELDLVQAEYTTSGGL